MATILLAWELGGGLGHLMDLRPLADGLARRGHRVVAVVRDLSSAHRVFQNPQLTLLQSPFKHQQAGDIEPTCTFAQILHNCGFGDVEALATLAKAWRYLYDQIKPDLIVFNHSPTALLAARGYAARRALIGTGFENPPDLAPLPNLRTWLKPDWTQLQAHEAQVLANINTVLARWGEPPLDRVTQLYHPIDENFLLTFRELDCYPQRESHRRPLPLAPSPLTEETPDNLSSPSPLTGEGRGEGAASTSPLSPYWGMWSAGLGEPPQWPPGQGQKIFAYLKPFPALPQLLKTLATLPNPSLIYAPGLDPRVRDQCRGPSVRFTDAPVEMAQVARECDLAILNGTHATAAAMLLAGKPALHIPIFLEQAINAQAAERLGAALCASMTEPNRAIAGLRSLLTHDRFAQAAQSFAARYAEFNPEAQIERLINRAEELANNPSSKSH